MNVLIIGSGAREQAIAKALARSPQKPRLFGYGLTANPGIQSLTVAYCMGDPCLPYQVIHQARAWQIDMAIIGPEAPLAQGLADALWADAIPTIGPKKCLAQLETDKAFTRQLMDEAGIKASPRYRVFHDTIELPTYLMALGEGCYVIKPTGLTSGKGVQVAGEQLHSIRDALAYCKSLHAQGMSFLVEEKLIGDEFSLLCFSDGKQLVPMPIVQDFKRAFVKNTGPNTGSMGSCSDANHRLPFLTIEDCKNAQSINDRVITALQTKYEEPYIGIVYGSFMKTRQGLRVIEFNARFGDPEALNVLAILKSDFFRICQQMIAGSLNPAEIEFDPIATVCQYAVPLGYPTTPLTHERVDISGVTHQDNLYIGSVEVKDEQLFTTASRTLAVLGMGATRVDAETMASQAMQQIKGPLFHREDIGTLCYG